MWHPSISVSYLLTTDTPYFGLAYYQDITCSLYRVVVISDLEFDPRT